MTDTDDDRLVEIEVTKTIYDGHRETPEGTRIVMPESKATPLVANGWAKLIPRPRKPAAFKFMETT